MPRNKLETVMPTYELVIESQYLGCFCCRNPDAQIETRNVMPTYGLLPKIVPTYQESGLIFFKLYRGRVRCVLTHWKNQRVLTQLMAFTGTLFVVDSVTQSPLFKITFVFVVKFSYFYLFTFLKPRVSVSPACHVIKFNTRTQADCDSVIQN